MLQKLRKILGYSALALLVAQPGVSAVRKKAPYHHEVKRGECLSIISRNVYEAPSFWPTIAKWNRLKNPHRIFPRQRLGLWKKPVEPGYVYRPPPRIYEKALVELKKEDPEYEVPDAKRLFEQGEGFFTEGSYEKALKKFRLSRETDEDFLPPWFYEMRTLRVLKRVAEADKVESEFLGEHPKLKRLPMFRAKGRVRNPPQ